MSMSSSSAGPAAPELLDSIYFRFASSIAALSRGLAYLGHALPLGERDSACETSGNSDPPLPPAAALCTSGARRDLTRLG